jgi:hypothetical protein
MALNDAINGLSDFLNKIGEFAKNTVDVYKDVYEAVKGGSDSSSSDTQTTPTNTNTYTPNLAWSDFKFTPNFYLMFGGLALLLVALYMMRK